MENGFKKLLPTRNDHRFNRTPILLGALSLLLCNGLMPHFSAAQDRPALQPATEPAPPPWVETDSSRWPRILMTNRIVDPDGSYGDAGSASLARLPTGVVVLCTARHLMPDTKLADLFHSIKSWGAYGRSQQPLVRVSRLAMDANTPSSFDGLILCPATQQTTWPTTVLPMRQTPLRVGETIYLVGDPFNEPRENQKVYKGVVRDTPITGNEMEYDVDGTFVTTGLSGAPVVDEQGRLAAINLGHLDEQNVPGKMRLTCMPTAEVLKVVQLPPDVQPVSDISGRPLHPLVQAAQSEDQRAAAALSKAQMYLDNKLYDKARDHLQAVIDQYPKTDAAKKARALIAQLSSP
jgi:hypothetical protein